MQKSIDRIRTTHVGSLPRPPELVAMAQRFMESGSVDRPRFDPLVRDAVRDVVERQAAIGLDIVNDGEMGKAGFIVYANERLSGFEAAPKAAGGSYWADSREARAFPAFYAWSAQQAGTAGNVGASRLVCTGPVRYVGAALLQRDLANLRDALAASGAETAFVTAISPANLEDWNANAYYESQEAYLAAIAEAMREEYRAIVEAGFLLQIDDPALATYYVLHPDASIEECRRWAALRVEALNHALRDIPPERVRYHTCYSINMGPRVHDVELKDIIDLVLRVNAGAYSFEYGNPRHEHEWHLWERVPLPAGKTLIPGVVSHSTVLVEHPELIAERLTRFANVVGRENVIAGGDCGFASFATSFELHPEVVWAKLAALVAGAQLASAALWGSGAAAARA